MTGFGPLPSAPMRLADAGRLALAYSTVGHRDVTVAQEMFDNTRDALSLMEAEFRARVERHVPYAETDVLQATWIECSCGWDQSRSKLDWWEHVWAAEAPR